MALVSLDRPAVESWAKHKGVDLMGLAPDPAQPLLVDPSNPVYDLVRRQAKRMFANADKSGLAVKGYERPAAFGVLVEEFSVVRVGMGLGGG